MRSRTLLLSCLGGAFVLGGLVTAAAIGSPDSAVTEPIRVKKCFPSTLRGVYGVKFEGQSLERGPFASVSRITFDGKGQFRSVEIGRFNGELVDRTFVGPYTVREDCTGFLDFSSTLTDPPHEAHGELVIVDGGKEFFVLDNEDGWVASGVGKRL